jgi:hypothetical protein
MPDEVRSADVMERALLERVDELKNGDPAAIIRQTADTARDVVPIYRNDAWVYRMVVGFLGAAIILVIVSYTVYALIGTNNVPDGLVAIGSAAIGALAGLLAPSPPTR